MSVLLDWITSKGVAFTATVNVTLSPTATDTATRSVVGKCIFRPITVISQLFDTARFGKEFSMVISDTASDINVGNKVEIASQIYTVAGKSLYEDIDDGSESHLELRIYKR